MRKRVSEDLTLFFLPTFGKTFARDVRNNLAIIGVGGNLGNSMRRFKKLALLLASHPRVRLVKTAPILKNPPFGYLDQPDFYNTLFLLDTTLSPIELLNFLLYVEKRFKRVRTFKNAPRTLDLDIIFYNDKKIDKDRLKLPHPHWSERDSVIIPLRFLLERG